MDNRRIVVYIRLDLHPRRVSVESYMDFSSPTFSLLPLGHAPYFTLCLAHVENHRFV
ncbi:hypothetical protein [Salmonella phage vB_SenS_SB13]|uniref:Uncharacterized protein n=1 Tax=Salmonella phage vB_SenS_SB13 TaxID=2591135 RepID=A0A5J6TFT1_9CAUD|nr:hypothetical protein HWC37_gp088 [Salmonella phage vB_SenS_SB13]QFG07622.1 hypothetical protein [Salmonella phage vB_SenS_SB13]